MHRGSHRPDLERPLTHFVVMKVHVDVEDFTRQCSYCRVMIPQA